MDRFALMVGVSHCEEPELPTLRRARTNVEVLKRSLQSTNSGFEVHTLWDAPQLEMAETIEQFFRHRDGDDQVFFLFSGYVFKDVDGQIYLSTPSTLIDDWGQLVRARTIPLHFLLNVMDASPAWRQVIIFDCCFRLTQGIDLDDAEVFLEEYFNQMVGDRRIVLTASTYTQHQPDPEALDVWSYTRYLAEGAATGAADTDCDGSLTVKELHHYAQRKLQIAAPNQQPQFYGSEATANQMLLQVPSNTPVIQYRQFLEKLAETSEIDQTEFRILTGRNRLNAFRQHLGISQTMAAEIEFEVLRPFQEHQQRKQLFQEYFAQLTEGRYESQ
ncbi:MAG: caspase family protein [Leptolyngbyaceae cyanobacterium bins.349]|nr:caspase family protein [Leptolyngbyaceae cyanobacterium bins.349]